MSFNKQLNWAVLGTGVIANEMAQARATKHGQKIICCWQSYT